jgi:hypothetical protein
LDKGSTNMTIRFAVVGINHNHIFGQVNALLGAGASFVGFFAPEDSRRRFRGAIRRRSASIVELVSLMIPISLWWRAPL